jgi:anaerobic dimethyl sulfoxide reductase subunit A
MTKWTNGTSPEQGKRTECTGFDFPEEGAEDGIYHSACAPNCRGRCPLRVTVRGGRVRNVEPLIPAAPEDTRACTLGLSHVQRIYDETRLTRPLKRVGWSPEAPNPGGRGEAAEFEPITWDAALSTIAQTMDAVATEYGPECVYFENGSGDHGTAAEHQARLAALFGGTTKQWSIDVNVGQGFRRVAGEGWFNVRTNAATDLVNASTLVVWGGDVFQSRLQQDASKLLDAVEGGTNLAVIDPMYTTTAAKADRWLPVAAGKDVDLALGMMHAIIDEQRYDVDFLRKRTLAPALVRDDGSLLQAGAVFADGGDHPVAIDETTGELTVLEPETNGSYALFADREVAGYSVRTGLDHVREAAASHSPASIAERVNVPAETIRTVARWLAADEPGGIVMGLGVDRYVYGHVFGQAVAVLLGLTGDFARHGSFQGGLFAGAYPDFGDYADPPDAPGASELWQTDILQAMETGEPYPLKAMYAQESNFVANQLPDRQRWLDAIESLDLIAVADMHHTPTVQYADVVLPAAHWFEKEDVVGGATHPHVLHREQVHEPLGEAKSDYWIVSRLAGELGFGDHFRTDKSVELREMLASDDHVDYDALRENGTVEKPTPEVRFEGAFDTPTGRLEIYDPDAPTADVDHAPSASGPVSLEVPKPIESRTDDHWPGAEEYPLTFVQKHSRWRIHSQFESLPWLREQDSKPLLDLNPVDAAARGINDGDLVRVYNDRGEMVLRANVSDGIQPGLVNTDQGWWARDYVAGHHNDLTHAETSDVTKNFAFYDTRVAVKPADDLEPARARPAGGWHPSNRDGDGTGFRDLGDDRGDTS